jgi:Ion channel
MAYTHFQWKLAEVLSCLFSILGIITETIDYETNYSSKRTHDNCIEEINNTVRYITLALTIISVILLIARRYFKVMWYQSQLIEKKIITFKLIIELLVVSIFPYPNVNGYFVYKQSLNQESSEYYDNQITLCYTYSEILYFLMFFRLFFLIRTLFSYAPYQDKHARAHCISYKTKANFRFSVKSMMKAHPILVIYLSIFPSFFLFGIFLRIFERPYVEISSKNYSSYQNSVWNSFVAMSTIGYGDIYPSTLFGRCIGIICAMWGAYAFSMVVFTMKTGLELNANQVRALIEIKETRAAGKVICRLVEYYIAKKHNKRELNNLWNLLLVSLKKFQLKKKNLKFLKKKIAFKETVPKTLIKNLENRIAQLNNKIEVYLTN